MNRQTVDQLARIIENAAREALEKHGANIGVEFTAKRGRAMFDSTGFDLKLRIDEGNPAEAERAKWAKYAALFNVPAEAYGKTFQSGGHEFRAVELNPNAPKYPLIGERTDGKRFKFTEAVLRKLRGQTEEA